MDSLLAYAQENSSGGGGVSIIWIIGVAGLWKMFEKAGEPGWIGIIPFYREYKLCEKVMNNPWYWVREFVIVIPVIGLIGFLYFKYQIGKAIAKSYGQEESYAWGYTFPGVDSIFYCIAGFGDTSYYGPYGAGDNRTGEARQAKTVDFDVVRNTPADDNVVKVNQVDEGVVINDVRKANSPAGESEVEFTFDDPNE